MEIEGSASFVKQCQQIRDESGFDSYEGGSFNPHDFAYLALLQENLKHNDEKAQKFHVPQRHKNVVYCGRQYFVNQRTCLWTGKELLILSSVHAAVGASSLFRRAVTVPKSADDSLQFYAMITPKPENYDETDRYQRHLQTLNSDYQSSYKAYLNLYPYVRPRLFSYYINEGFKRSLILPALLTRSTNSWTTIYRLLRGSKKLTAEGFLSIMGWFMCVVMLQKLSLVHCDMSDVNVTVFGPGVLCQLIDLNYLAHLNQEGVHISKDPLSAYPDHCAPNKEYDHLSDVFSVSTNLLMFYALTDEPSKDKAIKKLQEMNEYTNENFDTHYKERIDKYSTFYMEIKNHSVNKLYADLAPHLLNFTNSDRSERTSVLDMFSDQNIMEMIYRSLNNVMDCEDYAPLFIEVDGLTLRDSIEQLKDNKDQQDIAATSILLLLVYALHCRTLDEEVRIDHKKKIEMILEGIPLSPSCQTLVDRYETPFPGRRTDNLIDPAIDDFESEIIELLFKEVYYEYIYTECGVTLQNLTARVEHLTNRQECKTILRQLSERVEHLVARDVCETTLQQLSERVEHLTSREKCKTTLQEQPNRVEKNSQKNDGESKLFSVAGNRSIFNSEHKYPPEESHPIQSATLRETQVALVSETQPSHYINKQTGPVINEPTLELHEICACVQAPTCIVC